MTTNDYNRATLRHWLGDLATGHVGAALSLERAPSADAGGTIPGQLTWYDYAGKAAGWNNYAGSTDLPSFIARVMPDGTSLYQNFQRNIYGWPTNIIDGWTNAGVPLSRTNTYTYAANGVDLVAVTNALGIRTVANIFNNNHQVTSSLNASNELTSFAYDAYHRLTNMTSAAGLVTSYSYGTDGFLAQTADLGLRTNSYTWGANGLVYTHTDELGLTTTHYWDALQRPTLVVYPDGSSISKIYTALDLTATKDRLTNWTYYAYNGVRQKIWETNANQVVTQYGYCDCGALMFVTNAYGVAGVQTGVGFTYDNQGHQTQAFYPDGTVVTNFYDPLGRLTVVNNNVDGGPLGPLFLGYGYFDSTTNTYDNLCRPTGESNAAGQVKAAAYDAADRVISDTDANGVTVTSTYDALDRIATRSYPDGGTEHFGYTANVARPTSYANQVTNTYFYGYDSAGRKTNEVCTGISTNSFAYDASGNLTALTDGNGHITHWYYDQYGRLTSKVDALGNTVFTYQYNANNWLTNRSSLTKGATLYGYDAVGNPLSVNYQHSHALAFSYDALNRVTNMLDGVGTTTYAYDSVGQLLSETGPWSGVSVTNSYLDRLRQTMTVQAPGAWLWVNNYSYDSARRPTHVTSQAGSFTYWYRSGLPSLEPVETAFGSGAYIANTYDNVARLLSTALTNSLSSPLDLHQYAYNLAGQRTSLTNMHGDYRSYTYDNAGELKTALGREAGGSRNRWQEQFGYTYDAAGNLTVRTDNLLTNAFSVNAANELTASVPSGTLTVAGGTSPSATSVSISGSASGSAAPYNDGTWAVTNAALPNGSATYIAAAQWASGQQATSSVSVYLPLGTSYTYDPNGNLLTDGNRCFAYDDENQLASVWLTNGWRTDFFYDGRMRMRQRIDYAWSGSGWVANSTVRYVYDGNLVVQEQDQNNSPMVTYTRGNDLSGTIQGAGGIGGLLARTDNSSGASAYYFADGNGNITCLTDGSQALASYLYDPYGRILSQSGWLANANVYRFSSKEFHVNSGLVYYGYRFYDPNLQRWPNRDPLGEWGGVNLDGFCDNDPLDEVDPDGEDGISIPWPDVWVWAPPVIGPLGPVGLGLGVGAGLGLGIHYFGNQFPPGPVAPPIGGSVQNAPPTTAQSPSNPGGGGTLCESRQHGKGERGRTGNTGAPNKFKHWKTDPDNPKQIKGKDQQGKTVYKPKPPDFPPDR